MKRVYNFSAGPAVLPEEVLREAAEEMLDYQGTGMSVMEMSHRSQAFQTIIDTAEQDLRDLMGIPDNYKVLFLQGGASQQFSAIPMNLMKNGVADYIVTGQWAKKAYQEAQKYGKVYKVASSEDETFSYIPDCSDLPIHEDADYVYICENNTIYGTKFKKLPNTKGKPLVADVSSCFLVILDLPDMKIAVLNYTYGTNGIPLPDDMLYAVDLPDGEQIVADIQRAEESADFFFVKHFFLKKRQNSPFSSREIPCFRWVIFIYTSLRMRACSIR